MMADAPGQGLVKSLRNMWRDGGLLGMWSGNAATLAKIFPQTAIQFAAFHTLKEAISANGLVRATIPSVIESNVENTLPAVE